MSPEVHHFKFSTNEWYERYSALFRDCKTLCRDIDEFWGIELDLALEPSGWNAVWEMSEESCEDFNMLYPASVIVKVDSIDFVHLEANVTVKAAQEDIVLHDDLVTAPLVELHPMILQTDLYLSCTTTALWLEQYRYFYNYIWYPFDADKDITLEEWCRLYLRARLDLWSQKDKNLHFFLTYLCKNLKKIDEELERCSTDERYSQIFSQCCLRREKIKTQLTLLENKDLKASMMQLCGLEDPIQTMLVFPGGDMKTQTRLDVDESLIFTITKTLQKGVDRSRVNTTILLPPGQYDLSGVGAICYGGAIKGLTYKDNTDICPVIVAAERPKCAVLLDLYGLVSLSYLMLKRHEGTIIQVNNNLVTLDHCCLVSTGSNVRGVVVCPGCTLQLDNCELSGFDVGILLCSNSQLIINNCVINDCVNGVRIMKNCDIKLNNVKLSNMKENAILVQDVDQNICVKGSSQAIETLNNSNIPGFNVKIDNVVFDNNHNDVQLTDTGFKSYHRLL